MSRSSQKILLLLSGSISCYKACDLLSKLKGHGFDTRVGTTESALRFVGSATLEGLSGQAILRDIFEDGKAMDHIYWARWADLILVYPGTANTINRLANGLADDCIGSLFLANNFKKPFWIAPAMNTQMYNHPITQQSMQKLASMGCHILPSPQGTLACGENGVGRLLEPPEALKMIQENFDGPFQPEFDL